MKLRRIFEPITINKTEFKNRRLTNRDLHNTNQNHITSSSCNDRQVHILP